MDTLQKHRKIRTKDGTTARRRRCKETKTKECSSVPDTPYFLKQKFPGIKPVPVGDTNIANRISRDGYRSLKNLCELYGCSPMKKSSKPFPFSIADYYSFCKSALEKLGVSEDLIITSGSNGSIQLATVKELQIGLILFYMPLEALWKLHEQRNHPARRLLLSVFAYLHQVTGMPLLTDYSYLKGTYDAMKESYEDDRHELEENETAGILNDFRKLERLVPLLNKQIRESGNLHELSTRCNAFVPASEFDMELKIVAEKFAALHANFPDRSFMEYSSLHLLYPGEQETTYMEQYYSFCWSYDDWMMDQLMEWVNCDLQERSVFELPCSMQFFDTPQTEINHTLPFQAQLLNLLNELSDAINLLYG